MSHRLCHIDLQDYTTRLLWYSHVRADDWSHIIHAALEYMDKSGCAVHWRSVHRMWGVCVRLACKVWMDELVHQVEYASIMGQSPHRLLHDELYLCDALEWCLA